MGKSQNKYYKDNVSKLKDKTNYRNPETSLVNTEKYEVLFDREERSYNHGNMTIYYISDIHLDHKILKKFPEPVKKSLIESYIKELVLEMVEQFDEFRRPYIMFSGDLSFNFNFSKIFYTELKLLMPLATIFVVLGNHELWDSSIYSESDSSSAKVDKIIKKYRRLFDNLEFHFIHNELVVYQYSKNPSFLYEVSRMNEQQILAASDAEIIDFTRRSRLTILGGIGFSGYATDYNATKGLYRDTITILEDDIGQSTRFEQIYLKCKSAISDRNVVVLTHTPKENWSKDKYCINWIYTSGHTHNDRFELNKERTIYSDNQIGYHNSTLNFKHFYTSAIYDIFDDYSDGIYEITKQQFLDFYRGKGSSVQYSRKNTQIYMLKKNGVYCFIQEYLKTGSLCILNGGSPIKLKPQRNLQYYYDNLDVYSEAINDFLDPFNESLRSISNFVRSFGGSGRIHGFIVDIDFYNHLYLNPFDGSVTPYFATSINSKYVYKNLASLLKFRNKNLYKNYVRLIESEVDSKGYALIHRDKKLSKDAIHLVKTEIYKFSRIAMGLQYLTRINVIRMWNDSMVDKKNIDNLSLIESVILEGNRYRG